MPAPKSLHAFVYRADERVPSDHTYALMPAFAWSAVQGARVYDLELATSKSFADATTIYRNEYQAPVASIQEQVPWMTGHPYALWVRVRVHAGSRTSAWSQPFGFNTAWQDVPAAEPAPEGLLRWTPVSGATGYDVWLMNASGWNLHFSTLTNVADEREYWTFHPQLAATIKWRVRAVRVVNGPGTLPNGIPVVTNGPYSPVYTTTTSAQIHGGTITPIEAVSDTTSTPAAVNPHQLTPGFAWTGDTDVLGDRSSLWRVYVFSDRGCVNPVLTGSVVGSQAWAPRDIDPLTLPADTDAMALATAGNFTGWSAQSKTFAADEEAVNASESTTVAGSASTGGTLSTSGGTSNSATPDRAVSLADNGWPQGRYWWTVVPVAVVQVPPPPSASGSSSSSSGGKSGKPAAIPLEYHDMALPQDLCSAGAVWPFGMQSAPITTTTETPYASGVVKGNRVVSAASRTPSFQELPVVTWKPAMTAVTYEVQLSRSKYPWNLAKSLTSVVPSAVLPLTRKDVGTWYYRVRGVNPDLTGPAQKLAWSKPTAIKISGDRFVVVK